MWIGESKVAKADVMSVSPSSEPQKLSTGADLPWQKSVTDQLSWQNQQSHCSVHVNFLWLASNESWSGYVKKKKLDFVRNN